MDVLDILAPLFLYNQSYIEYAGTVNITIANLSCASDFNNPSFDAANMIALLPTFKNLIGQIDDPENPGELIDAPYNALFEAYRDIANEKFNYQKFGADWYWLMSLYIAHTLQMAFKNLENESNYVAIGNQDVSGIIQAGTAGDVSFKINNLVDDKIFSDAGQYNLTQYGKRFWDTYIRYAKLLTKGLY